MNFNFSATIPDEVLKLLRGSWSSYEEAIAANPFMSRRSQIIWHPARNPLDAVLLSSNTVPMSLLGSRHSAIVQRFDRMDWRWVLAQEGDRQHFDELRKEFTEFTN